MSDLFSIGEAAKAASTTSETLRHYDRIDLVKPSKKNKLTNYRYYTKQDIVRLNTVRALQQMDLPLQKIKEVLEYDDLENIIEFLSDAEKKADDKIAAIQHSKAKILAAKHDYESKLRKQAVTSGYKLREYPARVILLSDTLIIPALDNLWNYLDHFYNMLPESLRTQFEFEDLAGVYTNDGYSRLFAVCVRFANMAGLETLPAGQYLCADCTEEEKLETTNQLMQIAKKEYHVIPQFTVEQIIVSGILQWKYQIQVYVGEAV